MEASLTEVQCEERWLIYDFDFLKSLKPTRNMYIKKCVYSQYKKSNSSYPLHHQILNVWTMQTFCNMVHI